jgi:colanic acid biosynthesis glycosyl transferase WcaI
MTGKPNYPSGKFYKGYNFLNRRAEVHNNIEIIRTPLFSRGSGNSFRLIANYLSFAFFASFTSLFRVKGKYDIIFVFEPSPITVGIPAILLKKKLKVPIFFWVLDLWPESAESFGKILYRFNIKFLNSLVKFIYRNCDKIFISSRSFSESIENMKVEKGKIVYFPNWAEESYLIVTIDKLKYKNLMPPGFVIMFAGNIGESQDFEAIIDTVELLKGNKDIQWVIIGEGRKRQWLEDEISNRDLSSSIKLLGSFPVMEMPDLFCHADALLVSLKKTKIFSLTVPAKIQTYLAFGKPILGMLDGEGAAIIEEAKAGFVCESGNSISLSANIQKLFELDDSKKQEMSECSKKYYKEHFERSMLLERFENEYEKFLKQ